MRSLKAFVTSLDAFGEPISINYKGDSTYKTCLGAIFTIGLKSFVLFYALAQLVALFQFKDPEITQYDVYEPRTEDVEFNLHEGRAELYFALITVQESIAVEFDPKYLTL